MKWLKWTASSHVNPVLAGASNSGYTPSQASLACSLGKLSPRTFSCHLAGRVHVPVYRIYLGSEATSRITLFNQEREREREQKNLPPDIDEEENKGEGGTTEGRPPTQAPKP